MPTRPPTHGQLGRQSTDAAYERERNDELHRRLIRSARWQRFRKWFIDKHPLCADCEEEGRTSPTEHVHHVRKLKNHPEDLCDEKHCRPLCESHHNRRTARGE